MELLIPGFEDLLNSRNPGMPGIQKPAIKMNA
jgi:hypothetical protein